MLLELAQEETCTCDVALMPMLKVGVACAMLTEVKANRNTPA